MKARIFVRPLIFVCSVMLLWELLCRAFAVPTYLLPRPTEIATVLARDGRYLLGHAAVTLEEAVLGLVFAVTLGFLSGVLFTRFNTIERTLLPLLIMLQGVPIVAIAPLLILWLGSGLASKVALAAVLCYFPMTVSTQRGLRAVRRRELDLMHTLAATEWQIFWKLRFPRSVSFMMAGMRVSASFAVIGAIVAEYAGADQGIGYVITQATYRLDTPLLFAAILLSALGGLLLFGSVVLLERYVLFPYSVQNTTPLSSRETL